MNLFTTKKEAPINAEDDDMEDDLDENQSDADKHSETSSQIEKKSDVGEAKPKKRAGFISYFSRNEEYIEPKMPYMGPQSRYNQVVDRIHSCKPGMLT